MPKARILSHQIDKDSIETLDQKDGLFNPVKVEDVRTFDSVSQDAMEERAIENGILDKAFENAKNIREIADSFSVAEALLTYLYSHDDNTPVENGKVSLSDVKRYFHCYESFLRCLNAIESKLSISIPPILLNDLPREEQQDIDELYLLLCEKKVVRLNAKLTSTDSMSVDMKYTETPLTIGSKIVLTFLSGIKFNFLKQAITLHTANLLINAIVKDIQKSDDGTVQILYGDTDSKPMYISFSAFETVEEAKHEENTILQHDEIYVNALTSNAYINQYYEE